MKKKKLYEAKGMRREGGSIGSIQPIDMKLGMCNKCPVCFQLSIVFQTIENWYKNIALVISVQVSFN